MCDFFSGIITRKGKVLIDASMSHEKIKEKHKLDDKESIESDKRDWLPFEITPVQGKNIFSKVNKKNWKLIIGASHVAISNLPEWVKKQDNCCWKGFKDYMKVLTKKPWFNKTKEFIAEIPEIPYLKPDGKPKKEWKLFEADTWDAAWDAARDAAGDAARDAAGDAAWDAAGDAARDAAWGAARDAAWGAAWGAARDAAWGAARDAAWGAARDAARDAALMARIKICLGLKLAKKHVKHVEKRMEVWRKGYALRCDINGVLYVYAKKIK